MGNPAIFPLIYGCESADVVIVHINPLFRAEVPRSAEDILNRINEISFNSSLMREMRAISFVTRLVTQQRVADSGLKHVLIHSIADDGFMGELAPTSKYNADWDFLIYLRDQGRKCAGEWLAQNFGKLGVEFLGGCREGLFVTSSAELQYQFLAEARCTPGSAHTS